MKIFKSNKNKVFLIILKKYYFKSQNNFKKINKILNNKIHLIIKKINYIQKY